MIINISIMVHELRKAYSYWLLHYIFI